MTRTAGIECATWMARLSRLYSSTIVRHRKVRPELSVSETKSMLQRSFGRPSGSRTSRGI